MGYSINRSLVLQNIPLLEEILSNLEQGEPTLLPTSPDEISSLSFSINRVLKAAQTYLDISQGRYTGIRELVIVKTSNDGSSIKITPKGGAVSKLMLTSRSEAWVLLYLSEFLGNITPIEFHPSPSFNEAEFITQLDSLGWILHPQTREEKEDKVSYVFERKEEAPMSGFGLLVNQSEG